MLYMKILFNKVALLSVLIVSTASAVEIIPVDSQSWIVNIDAQVDALRGNSPGVYLEAGEYVVSPIDVATGGKYTAWNGWSYTECQDPEGCPKNVPGFSLAYGLRSPDVNKIFTQNAAGEFVDDGLAACFMNNNRYVFCETSASKKNYPNADLAYTASHFPSKFHLETSGNVGFGVDDLPEYLADNQGGVSILLKMIRKDSAPLTLKSGGLRSDQAVCQNLTTRKSVRIRLDGQNEVNCTASGLKYKPGNKVRMYMLGRTLP
jgi:hypothetical protein